MKNQLLPAILLLAACLYSCRPEPPEVVQVAVQELPIPGGIDEETRSRLAFINRFHQDVERSPDDTMEEPAVDSLRAVIGSFSENDGVPFLFKMRARRLLAAHLQNIKQQGRSIEMLRALIKEIEANKMEEPAYWYELSYMYNLLGTSYDLQYEFYMSRHYFERSLQLNLEHHFYIEAMKDYTNIGLNYINLHNFELSDRYIDSALYLAKRYRDYFTSRNDTISLLGLQFFQTKKLGSLANEAFLDGDTLAAENLMEECLKQYRDVYVSIRQSLGQDSVGYLAITNFTIASYCSVFAYHQPFLDTAEHFLERTIQLVGDANPYFYYNVQAHLAYVFSLKGDCQKAVGINEEVAGFMAGQNLTELMPQLDVYFFFTQFLQSRLLSNCALASGDTAMLAEAAEKSWEAIHTYEFIINRLGTEESMGARPGDFYLYYSRVIDIHLRAFRHTGDEVFLKRALQATDMAKANLLRRSLSRKAALRTWTGVKKQLLEREQELRDKINLLRATAAQGQQVGRELEAALQEQLAFFKELEESENWDERSFFQERLKTVPFPVEEAQKELLGKQKAIVTYQRDRGQFNAFVLTADKVQWFELPYDTRLIGAIEEVRQDLSNEENAAKPAAHLIYSGLFKPIADTLRAQGIKELAVVPDHYLNGIVFGLLPIAPDKGKAWEEEEMVIDSFIISYHYSITSFLEAKELRALQRKPTREWGCFAVTDFSGFDAFPGTGSPPDNLSEIGRAVSGIQSRYFKNEGSLLEHPAQRSELLSQIEQFRILQLATHGVQDEEAPDNYMLQFLPEETGQVSPIDIYNYSLETDLAILICCGSAAENKGQQTAQGRRSLARAFLYAGAPAVIAGNDNLKDSAAADILQRFYHYWVGEGERAIVALWKAKQDYRKNHPSGHPFNWANIILIGDPDVKYK